MSSKTLVDFQWTAWRYIAEDKTFQHELYSYAKRKPQRIRCDATQDMTLIAFEHVEEEEDNEFLIMARAYFLKLEKMEPSHCLFADKLMHIVLLEGHSGPQTRNQTVSGQLYFHVV
jgi:hypothetical protein